MDIQGQLPAALCALHNFILTNEVDAVSDCSMGRLDDDAINSWHDEALFQDTFDELAEETWMIDVMRLQRTCGRITSADSL
jgi:hypothetical protein